MSRPRIVERSYFEFKSALQRAADQGTRIEPKDKVRWKAWVRANKVQEAAFKTLASRKFEEVRSVIIDDDSDWGGYYIYTTVEEACLKWTRE